MMDTQHPDSLQKIQQLESIDKNARLEAPEVEFGKPNWIKSFDNIDNLQEGEIVHLVGCVEPVGDPNLKIEWFLNGAPLQNCKSLNFSCCRSVVYFTIFFSFSFFVLVC